jgi:predicted nucleic acid-binding Zn ribbon protein
MDILDPGAGPCPETCLACGGKLTGRIGKKFCSDQCRATFHNRRKTKEEQWIQQLNRVLRKNRSVLKNLNPKGYSTVRQELLKDLGFNFHYYTHQYHTNSGNVYYFCYEWGYRILEEGKILIVNWQPYMNPAITTS